MNVFEILCDQQSKFLGSRQASYWHVYAVHHVCALLVLLQMVIGCHKRVDMENRGMVFGGMYLGSRRMSC
jgi:hypothetical protein